MRKANPSQASSVAPTPVRKATPPPAAPPPAAVVATVSPIYPDAALIAADDAACEQALTNWLRAPGLAADASAQEWRDAWRVAAAAADVALQKTVQVDQERIRVTQEYETFRAGAANLATEQARTWHSQLASAKARVSALETTLARYQAAYPPPPIDDEPTPEGDRGDAGVLAAAADSALTDSLTDAPPAEAAEPPRAVPDLAPTPRPGRGRSRLAIRPVATPAPRPRRYDTRSSSRRGRAD